MTAKEMWAECGFPFITEENEYSIVYSNYSDGRGIGAECVEIDIDGDFIGWCNHGGDEMVALTFTKSMFKALMKQFEEFNVSF